ncbi:trypsin-like serine protease [Mycetocola sp. JXN-3]|uniref:S1 family peptidase n=1 Tax=Mycetocola sp. JXN-3 TaxID=2116510 RepID=UPI001CAA8461|nr:serine protease [Mycetocola sp. JXN-3]
MSGISTLRRVMTRSTLVAAACALTLTAGAATANAATITPAAAHSQMAATGFKTIVGGDKASEKYPFMVSIPIKAPASGLNNGNCGAALIDPEWVVTAAHCLDMQIGSFAKGKVRIGSDKRSSGGTVRTITQVFLNPGYAQGQPNQNDVALVRLDRPVKNKPIVIAKRAADFGSATRILGFGITKPNKDPQKWKMSEKLRQLDTMRGSLEECDPGFAGDTRLCTVSHTANAMACNGDSGGPQIQKGKDNAWELIGVTSGPGAKSPSCEKGPGLYTNVTAFHDWISQTIEANK